MVVLQQRAVGLGHTGPGSLRRNLTSSLGDGEPRRTSEQERDKEQPGPSGM